METLSWRDEAAHQKDGGGEINQPRESHKDWKCVQIKVFRDKREALYS